MQPSVRMVPAASVALFAGAVRAAQLQAPQLLVGDGVSLDQLSVVLPALGLLSLAISPFGAAVAGYVWGAGADVPRRWRTFVGVTFAAAVAGFGGAYLLSAVALALQSGSPTLGTQPLYQLTTALGLVGLPLVALAGGAIAEFRSAGVESATRHGHRAE